jgi:hypothetical protein
MPKLSTVSKLLHMGWLTVILVTAALWMIPLLPFKVTILFACGLANGWLAKSFCARYI